MKYLVCFDGSAEAKNAVLYAANHAKKDDEIVLFGAYIQTHESPHIAIGVPSSIYIPPAQEWLDAERKRRHAVAKYRLDCAKSDLEAAGFTKLSEICVESDDVRDAVMAAVAQVHADAIVVGSRGFNMIKATFMGSLSSYLVSNSPVPVIVARNAQTNQRT